MEISHWLLVDREPEDEQRVLPISIQWQLDHVTNARLIQMNHLGHDQKVISSFESNLVKLIDPFFVEEYSQSTYKIRW